MSIIIHKDKITPEIMQELVNICPFGAMEAADGTLTVNSNCKNCKVCVKRGPSGAVTWQDDICRNAIDKSAWNGVAVFAQCEGDHLHPVTPELLGKAKELAEVIHQKVMAVLIGNNLRTAIQELLSYGADEVYVYEHPQFENYTVAPYANAFSDFINNQKPGSILVGATNLGRSLAPCVAARYNAGLTADCTVLQMKENTDLVQIRPAFGGNIMAQIVTPNARPQFCTVRYKVFSAPNKVAEPQGTVHYCTVTEDMLRSNTQVLRVCEKPKHRDISEADVIVACGRGFTKEADLEPAKELARLLNAQLACTRPLVEAGWMDPRQQIGLSGRTVKPKLIITLGISGSVQFVAGMNGSSQIIAINSDPNAPIFDIAHVGLVGDIHEILHILIQKLQEGKKHV